MVKKGILFFCLLFFVESASAWQLPLLQRLDTLTYRKWTLEDGLPVNSVNSIAQDSTGYLWISTYDGLVRFDGLNFNVYTFTNTEAMPHNRATSIYIQNGVGIWAALEYGGVLLIQDETFTHFGEENGFTNSDLTKMYEASDGRMFFITHQGVYVYDDGSFSRFFRGLNEKQNQVSTLFQDRERDHSFWLATNDGLLNIHEEDTLQYDLGNRSSQNSFLDVERNKDGVILAGTRDGVYELIDNQLVSPSRYNILKGKTVHEIYEDDRVTLYLSPGQAYIDDGKNVRRLPGRQVGYNETYIKFHRDADGILWMIGDAGSLSILKDGRIQKFQAIEEIQDYYFNSIFEDREGNLWLTTNSHGLISISKSKVRTIGPQEGLSGKNILALFQDSKDRFWVGTRGNGLNKIEEDEITTYDISGSITSNIVQSVGEDADGNIWVGYHQAGLDRISTNGVQHFDISTNLETNDIRSIFKDSRDQLWLGTYGGLVKFNPKNNQHTIFGVEDGMSGNQVRYIAEDDEGALWIGMLDGGVSRFKNGTFKNYTTEQGLSSNNIRSIYVDEQDPQTIWVGSENNGLNRIRIGTIDFVSTAHGLPDHIIHWISQDRDGWLWMSSNRGIFKIHKAELNKYLDGDAANFTLLHYGRADGMRNPEANGSIQEAGLRTDNGYFWFSTQDGVAIFQSDMKQANTVPPTVVIKSIKAGNELYDSSTAVIEQGYKTFDVTFNALTYIAPEKTRYRYRLKGFDEHWIEVSGQHHVSYADVPAGEYTFEVVASNNDGVWSEQPAASMITIQPFFYEQWWFYILIILFIGGGYYGASRLKYQYLVRKQERMERIIEEQTAQLRKEKNEIEEKSEIIRQQARELEESNKTKDKFFSLIAHDLRNPFQAILGYSEMMLTDVEQADRSELKESLQHIHDSSKSLLTLVEHLLNWASLNTGKIQPKPEKVNLKELTERTHQLFEHVANQKGIKLEVHNEDSFYLYADLNMLQTILRNLVSNAIKFTKEGGLISIHLYSEEEGYIIEIRDSGIGMSEKMARELLYLDSNTSRMGTRNEKGTGLGLLICKEMMSIHNGLISVESSVGKGTKFILKFPKKGLENIDNSPKKKEAD